MAKRNRPYWQTEPCPTWCMSAKRGHDKRDNGGDRLHLSKWEGRVTLTAEDGYRSVCSGVEIIHPVHIEVSVEQDHREVEPHIVLSTMFEGKALSHDVTITETRKLIKVLSRALGMAESA